MKRGDRVFYFTTCGWMMWNWLISALAARRRLLLYDGVADSIPTATRCSISPSQERCTLVRHLGQVPRRARDNAGLDPASREPRSRPLAATLASTGSPLAPEGFDYVYRDIKDDLCLSSIAGGTDIIGCFVGGNPIGPVWRGEIQKRHLAMAVEVFDADGNPSCGEKGELVCTKPFPSMPIYRFWNDPDGRDATAPPISRPIPNVWHHGDFIEH